MTDRVFVYYIPLPEGVNEAIMTCFGGYTIYIDPRQSKAGMERSFKHALKHIQSGDFFKTDVQSIESKAHKKGGN